MAYVVVNALTVPEGAGPTLEQRFAARAGAVDRAPGFERFELLRPVEGTATYMVYTRWRSREDYEAWLGSEAFAGGHGRGPAGPGPAGPGAAGPRPAATGSQIWAFEVATASDPAAPEGQ